MRTNDPRFPKDFFRSDFSFEGWPSRVLTMTELRACGFSEAEAHTLRMTNWTHGDGDPLVNAKEHIVGAKVVNNWPLLPHEKEWLVKHAMEVDRERYLRLGRERFLNCYPSQGLKIEKWLADGYQPTYEEYFGVEP